MLKKIRWRFIGISMAAFFLVILTLLCIVNVGNYISITSSQDNILQSLYETTSEDVDPSTPPLESIERYSPEVPYMIRFFSIDYNSDDTVTIHQEYIASLSDSEVKEYADKILEKDNENGYYKGYRFLKVAQEDKTSVYFLNSEREIQSINTLLLITIVIALISLLLVFILVVIFSKKAILPYAKNMEAQKQFITNASHELKTPLTSIVTSADVLAMEYENNEWIENIQNQSNKLSKLITNLVTLSRLNEEEPFPIKTEFSLSDTLWEISESFVSISTANNKKFIQDIEDNLTLIGDKNAIGQAITILLDNALKYSSNNGNIYLSAHKKGKKIEIKVENSFDSKIDTSRLFERFYRDDTSHSSKVSGYGIGLSIAKATIERLNGTITAKQDESNLVSFIINI